MRRSFAVRVLCVLMLLFVAACGSKEEKVQKFFSKGQALYEQGHYVKAGLEFKNVLQIDPKYAKAYFMLGMSNLKRGEFKGAFRSFKKTMELEPENLEARVELANLYIPAGMPDKAQEMLSWVLARQPEHERALLMQGAVLLETDGPNAAIKHLEQLRQKGIKGAQLYILLAHAYQQSNNAKKAEKTLREGVEQNQKSIILHLKLAEILNKAGRKGEALSLLKKVITLDPDNPKQKFVLANFYLGQKKDKEAKEILARLIDESGDDKMQVRIDVAQFLHRNRLEEAAKIVLRQGIKEQPNETLQRRVLAGILLDEGESDQALQVLNENLKLDLVDDDPGIISTEVGLAGIHLRKGQLQEAGKLIDGVIKKSPKNIDAHYLKGKIGVLNGNYTGAVAEFRMAVNERPDNIGYHLDLVQAYLLDKEAVLGLDALKNAAKAFPDSKQVQQRLISLLASQGDRQEALSIAEKLYKRHSEDLEIAAQLADLQVTDGRVNEAVKIYQSLKNDDITGPFPYFRLAQVYAFGGEQKKADREVLQGLKKFPASNQLLKMAVKLAGKDLARALKLVTDRLTDNEKNSFAHNLAGVIYARKKDKEKAMQHFKRAAELAPKWPEPLNNLALYSLKLGDKDEAVAFLQKTLSLNPTDRIAFNALGSLREQSGEYDKAIGIYERALKKNPKLWDAANNLSFLLAEMGGKGQDLDRALSLAKMALDLNPDAPAVLDTLGWVYFKQGSYQLALSHLNLAVNKLKRVPAIVHYHLGMALLKKDKKDEARLQLQKALGKKKDFPGRHEAEAQLQGIS